MTAGVELIRRMRGKEAYALTVPLIVDANGQKFGKTEKGAVWLDPDRTRPYDLYQFFIRTDDRDVGRYLRYFTFLQKEAIEELEQQLARAPAQREAQKALAREVTALVHGEDEARKAEAAARSLFARTADGSLAVPPGAPTTTVARESLLGLALVDLLVQTGLCASKGAAR